MTSAQMTNPPQAAEIAAGAWLHNPVTGELARMNVGPADTAGRSVEADLWLQPGAAVAGAHVHDHLVEEFEVLEGRVGFEVASVEREMGAGDMPVTVHAGVAHDWWNAGDDVAHVRVQVQAQPAADGQPAARFVSMIETIWSLAALGRVNAKGMPGPLWLAAIAREYRDTIRFLSPPEAVQAALFGPLAAIAGRAGRNPLAPELHGPRGASAIPAPDEEGLRELLSRRVEVRAPGKPAFGNDRGGALTMRILFASTAGIGHFSPLVPFARACRLAGHDVLVAGEAGVEPLAGGARLPFWPVGAPAQEEVLRFNAGQDGLAPMDAIVRAFTGLYVGLYAKAALPGMLDVIEEWRPDVVVRESAEFASVVAAERLGVPQAEVGIGLSMQADGLLPLAAAKLDELRASVGLDPDPAVLSARALTLTLAPATLEDPSTSSAESVRRFRMPIGDSSENGPDPWGDPDAPLVYVSFGTEVPSPTRPYFPALYRRVLDALAELDARILMTIGDRRDPGELGPVPSSVRVERWVPQSVVVGDASAMVGHGGAGSTLIALAAGVPLAVMPMFADQPSNARRVAALGAGIALDGPASTSELGPAVTALLEDPGYRRRARLIAGEIRALPPIADAVDALTELAAAPAALS